jgi:peptide/nickel transport system permease protein
MTVLPVVGAHTRRPVSFGTVLLLALVALAVLGPFLAPHDPQTQDLLRALQPPDARHWLGLDHLGRDVLSRVLHGAPRSLGLAIVCVLVAAGVGVALGLWAAARGGWRDMLVMRLADLMLAFPGLLLALVFAGLLGGGVVPMLVGLKLALWPQFARMARAIAAGALTAPHVEAARLAGFPTSYILTRHVLGPVLRQTAPLAALGVGSAILSISSLGFLGLGLQPPTAEWGAMISELMPTMTEAPVQMAAPCVLIFLSTLAFVLVGQQITDATPGGAT